MLKVRRGFTLIEISLFLAITAVIFAGIVAGTQTSIYWQRYNDSVQSFAEFLRAEYSRVANVQNPASNGGASEHIIYGRLIDFNSSDGTIKSYSVIGKDISDGLNNGAILSQLAEASVGSGGYYNDEGVLVSAGLDESFTPKWGSRIQIDKSTALFKGTILIVRHPETGTIYTYIDNNPYDQDTAKLYEAINPASSPFSNSNPLDLCVNPDGDTSSGSRRKVTITANAHNASGVVVDGECEWSPAS